MLVLVIEDDDASRELLTLRLEALGCEVVSVDNPADGLAAAQSSLPGLVNIDLKLNVDSSAGIRLVRAIKDDPSLRSVPVAVHSVFVAHPSEAPAELPKVEGYLPKPFKLAELRELLEAARLRAS